MAFLLDTNACIRILNDRSDNLIQRFRQTSSSELLLCAVVKAELTYGAYKSQKRAENLRLLKSFFEPLKSIGFDDSCVEYYGQIRHLLEQEGTPIGPNDTMIAAIAIANDLILVTANEREFSRVPGLRYENWE